MVKITINGNTYEAQAGQMLIDVADAAGIEIPRFCYHKKLSVSANCRMCLVDVEKAPKPLPACATPVMDGMVVQTRSEKAQQAQKAVMEFLLINHPLDCPICDQGGECELQDVAMGYGQDSSRFKELKRIVPDKNLGPLISTEMTRCIHCTRCVRFGTEVAGIREMGATGRGENTRIGTYIERAVESELSGNMIDVCPVGALTSKAFRFHGRAWEMQQYPSIAPHDGLGSNIYMHVRRNKVLRVVPRENEAINEVWLSDRDRFSYEALESSERLLHPMIKRNGKWQETNWETALNYAIEGLKNIIATYNADAMGALASPAATLEELYLLQKLVRGLDCSNIDHRLHQIDFSDQNDAPLYPYLGQRIEELEKSDAVLLIGTNLRKEQPLLNHRLRKAALKNTGMINEEISANIMLINPVDYEFNLPIAEKIIAAPSKIVSELASVAKALISLTGKNISDEITDLLADVSTNSIHEAMAKLLNEGEYKTILVGRLASTHPEFSKIRALAAWIGKITEAKLGYLAEAGNSVGASLTGVLPHQGIAGHKVENEGKNAFEMLTKEHALKAYLLLGIEAEIDSYAGSNALSVLEEAKFVVCLNSYKTKQMQQYANVILPISLYPETSGTYVNCEGVWQTSHGVIPPPENVRPAWKVLRILGNLFDLDEFNYDSSQEIQDDIHKKTVNVSLPNNLQDWKMPESINIAISNEGSRELEKIIEMPMYAIDSMVRRATSLQNTQDITQAASLYVSSRQLKDINITSSDGTSLDTQMPIMGDERVPDGCILYYAAQKDGFFSIWNESFKFCSSSYHVE